ncbi:hypothetical protein ACA910_014963 [Epithemia clementina (nom. ined.)]
MVGITTTTGTTKHEYEEDQDPTTRTATTTPVVTRSATAALFQPGQIVLVLDDDDDDNDDDDDGDYEEEVMFWYKAVIVQVLPVEPSSQSPPPRHSYNNNNNRSSTSCEAHNNNMSSSSSTSMTPPEEKEEEPFQPQALSSPSPPPQLFSYRVYRVLDPETIWQRSERQIRPYRALQTYDLVDVLIHHEFVRAKVMHVHCQYTPQPQSQPQPEKDKYQDDDDDDDDMEEEEGDDDDNDINDDDDKCFYDLYIDALSDTFSNMDDTFVRRREPRPPDPAFSIPPNASLLDFLNPQLVFADDAWWQHHVTRPLQQGQLVVLRNALQPALAHAVRRAMLTAHHWYAHSSNNGKGYLAHHHNIYSYHDQEPLVQQTIAMLRHPTTLAFMTNVSHRECSSFQGLTSWYRPNDYASPHTDLGGQASRTVAMVWHLSDPPTTTTSSSSSSSSSSGWQPQWGGALHWTREPSTAAYQHASFNTLHLFSLDNSHGMHSVTPVSDYSLGQRVTFNGWFRSTWRPRLATATTTTSAFSVVDDDDVSQLATWFYQHHNLTNAQMDWILHLHPRHYYTPNHHFVNTTVAAVVQPKEQQQQQPQQDGNQNFLKQLQHDIRLVRFPHEQPQHIHEINANHVVVPWSSVSSSQTNHVLKDYLSFWETLLLRSSNATTTLQESYTNPNRLNLTTTTTTTTTNEHNSPKVGSYVTCMRNSKGNTLFDGVVGQTMHKPRKGTNYHGGNHYRPPPYQQPQENSSSTNSNHATTKTKLVFKVHTTYGTIVTIPAHRCGYSLPPWIWSAGPLAYHIFHDSEQDEFHYALQTLAKQFPHATPAIFSNWYGKHVQEEVPDKDEDDHDEEDKRANLHVHTNNDHHRGKVIYTSVHPALREHVVQWHSSNTTTTIPIYYTVHRPLVVQQIEHKHALFRTYRQSPMAASVFPPTYDTYRDALAATNDTSTQEIKDKQLFFIKPAVKGKKGQNIKVLRRCQLQYKTGPKNKKAFVIQSTVPVLTLDTSGPLHRRRFDLRFYVLIHGGKAFLHSHMQALWSASSKAYQPWNPKLANQIPRLGATVSEDSNGGKEEDGLRDVLFFPTTQRGWGAPNTTTSTTETNANSSSTPSLFNPNHWREQVFQSMVKARPVLEVLQNATREDPFSYQLLVGHAVLERGTGRAILMDFENYDSQKFGMFHGYNDQRASRCAQNQQRCWHRLVLPCHPRTTTNNNKNNNNEQDNHHTKRHEGDMDDNDNDDCYTIMGPSWDFFAVASRYIGQMLRDSVSLVMGLERVDELVQFREIKNTN